MGGSELDQNDLAFLNECFQEYGLASYPKLVAAYARRGVDTPVLIYKNCSSSGPKSNNYHYGVLIVQVAAIFARIDGVIEEDEVQHIRRVVKSLDFLPEFERIELTARAYYYILGSPEMAGSPHLRDYLRTSLDRTLILKRLEKLTRGAQERIVEIAKGVITSDSVIRRCEVELLQDIYRLLGISARSAKSDLEAFAKGHHILIFDNSPSVAKNDSIELEDVLSDLLFDYEDNSFDAN
jgi:tellurite resistance protein